MERLLKEITDLSVQGLTGAAVAISICRRLTEPIQERVHPAFEYWGHRDPTRGHECKVPREEIANRVARIMAAQIMDKSCPKAHCLKRPTDAVSLLESSELFCAFRVVSSIFAMFFRAHPLGCNRTRILYKLRSWSAGPPLLCLRRGPGKDAAEFSFDFSMGSEPEVEITAASGPPPLAALRRKTRRAVKKIQSSKAGLVAAQ